MNKKLDEKKCVAILAPFLLTVLPEQAGFTMEFTGAEGTVKLHFPAPWWADHIVEKLAHVR
ncbi:MAG: hypothetical protein V4641_12985 [Pseudomonadota bacterium]